jgi:hypothetical protein
MGPAPKPPGFIALWPKASWVRRALGDLPTRPTPSAKPRAAAQILGANGFAKVFDGGGQPFIYSRVTLTAVNSSSWGR